MRKQVALLAGCLTLFFKRDVPLTLSTYLKYLLLKPCGPELHGMPWTNKKVLH